MAIKGDIVFMVHGLNWVESGRSNEVLYECMGSVTLIN